MLFQNKIKLSQWLLTINHEQTDICLALLILGNRVVFCEYANQSTDYEMQESTKKSSLEKMSYMCRKYKDYGNFCNTIVNIKSSYVIHSQVKNIHKLAPESSSEIILLKVQGVPK